MFLSCERTWIPNIDESDSVDILMAGSIRRLRIYLVAAIHLCYIQVEAGLQSCGLDPFIRVFFSSASGSESLAADDNSTACAASDSESEYGCCNVTSDSRALGERARRRLEHSTFERLSSKSYVSLLNQDIYKPTYKSYRQLGQLVSLNARQLIRDVGSSRMHRPTRSPVVIDRTPPIESYYAFINFKLELPTKRCFRFFENPPLLMITSYDSSWHRLAFLLITKSITHAGEAEEKATGYNKDFESGTLKRD